MQKVLRENTILEAELKKDAESMECLKSYYKDVNCPCDVPYHPRHWTVDVIQGVHDHSFLLDCKVALLLSHHLEFKNEFWYNLICNIP